MKGKEWIRQEFKKLTAHTVKWKNNLQLNSWLAITDQPSYLNWASLFLFNKSKSEG